MHVPVRETPFRGPKPFPDPGLTCIDLLASADQANDDAPIFVSIDTRDQKLGFGHLEAGSIPLLLHESVRLLVVPSTLSLVEKRYVIGGRAGILKVGVAVMMHVLNEGFHLALGDALAQFLPLFAGSFDSVAGERFLQNPNQRAVAGKENAVELAIDAQVKRGDIQTDKRLSRARDTGYEAESLLTSCTGAGDDLRDCIGGFVQVFGTGITSRYLGNGVAMVERKGRLDDGRGGQIAPSLPTVGIDHRRAASVSSKNRVYHTREFSGGYGDWFKDSIAALTQFVPIRDRSLGLGQYKYGRNGWPVTGLVEVLQVERVVPHLVASLRCHTALADLELDHHDDCGKD